MQGESPMADWGFIDWEVNLLLKQRHNGRLPVGVCAKMHLQEEREDIVQNDDAVWALFLRETENIVAIVAHLDIVALSVNSYLEREQVFFCAFHAIFEHCLLEALHEGCVPVDIACPADEEEHYVLHAV